MEGSITVRVDPDTRDRIEALVIDDASIEEWVLETIERRLVAEAREEVGGWPFEYVDDCSI